MPAGWLARLGRISKPGCRGGAGGGGGSPDEGSRRSGCGGGGTASLSVSTAPAGGGGALSCAVQSCPLGLPGALLVHANAQPSAPHCATLRASATACPNAKPPKHNLCHKPEREEESPHPRFSGSGRSRARRRRAVTSREEPLGVGRAIAMVAEVAPEVRGEWLGRKLAQRMLPARARVRVSCCCVQHARMCARVCRASHGVCVHSVCAACMCECARALPKMTDGAPNEGSSRLVDVLALVVTKRGHSPLRASSY